MAIDLGDVHRLTYTHVVGGNLTTAGTMTLVINRPDGVAVTVTPVAPVSLGRYQYDYPTAVAGRHTARWEATGTGAGAVVDTFDVRPADPGYLVSLADVKAHLQLSTDSTNDDELRTMIEAATPVVEDVTGPVVPRTVTEVHDSGPVLVLNRAPVLSVTTIAPVLTGDVGYLPAVMDIDPGAGVVRRLDGGGFIGPLRVTYRAGYQVVPPNIVEAAKVIVAHLWDTQRGHRGPRPGFGDDTVPTPAGFLIPHRAMQLLKPHQRAPDAA